MKLATQFGIGAASIAVASILAFLPVIAAADEGRGTRDIRGTRPLAQRVEIAITDAGNVLVRGAKVTGITGSTLTVTTTAGSSTLSWAVTTGTSTAFVTSTGSASSLGAISVGDTVSFAGMLSGNGLSVNATTVKDWTLGVRERSITGPVRSINSTSTSLVLGNGNGKDNGNERDNRSRVTVQLTGSTTIMLGGATSTFASIQTGDKVKATGTMNAEGTVLTATSVSVTRPTVRLDTDEFRKKMKEWFSAHRPGVSGKSGRDD